MRTEPVTLLFVCTANIARSPYAERRARTLVGDAGVTVASAGVPGYPGRPMDTEMAKQLRLRGGDPSDHMSKSLDAVTLNAADVVLTFAFEHYLRIMRDWPGAAERTFGLRQFADALERIEEPGDLDGSTVVSRAQAVAQPNSVAFDVGDPYGRGRRAATAAAEAIDDCVESIISALLGRPDVGDQLAATAPRRRLDRPAPWRVRRPAPRRAINGPT